MSYDLVIRNGTVIDGSGRPRLRADVGVAGGTITTIGRITERGTDEIDAEGHFVTPGFIDGHTHLDAQVCWDPLGTCSSWHGVTSVVMGNCGFTVAPTRASEKHLALRSLERAEDISAEVLEAGVDWKWETYADYLDVVDQLPKGINFAGFVGHSALRPYVMGEAAFERAATDDELAAMRREVESAMRAGAIGFSTSRSSNHATTTDSPVASRLAEWREVQALVGVMRDLGGGLFQLAQESHADPVENAAYRERLTQLGIDSGRPILFVAGAPAYDDGKVRETLDWIESSNARGGRLVGCVHTREFISVMGFRVGLPFDSLPRWKELRSRSLDEQRAVLRDPVSRAPFVEEAMGGGYRGAIGAEIRPPKWDLLRVLHHADGPWSTVAELAAQRNTTPADVMIDESLDANFDRYFAQPFANLNLDAVLTFLRHPNTVIGIADTGAHVSQLLDSSIPTHLLSYWTREKEAFTWEQAVRMLTFDPASTWGFRDRGLLREAMAADITVFDPATVAQRLPETAFDQPGGIRRLTQKADGYLATVVNGSVLLRNGAHTGALPGQLLRGPCATS
jgi:N-acyl-D-amino-acid deacylase